MNEDGNADVELVSRLRFLRRSFGGPKKSPFLCSKNNSKLYLS